MTIPSFSILTYNLNVKVHANTIQPRSWTQGLNTSWILSRWGPKPSSVTLAVEPAFWALSIAVIPSLLQAQELTQMSKSLPWLKVIQGLW